MVSYTGSLLAPVPNWYQYRKSRYRISEKMGTESISTVPVFVTKCLSLYGISTKQVPVPRVPILRFWKSGYRIPHQIYRYGTGRILVPGTKCSSLTSITCFDDGNYTVGNKYVTTPTPSLYIVYPTEKGTYPVILFLHGFEIPDVCYGKFFEFIASHGYIIVAPGKTLCGFLKGLFVFSAVGDVDDAAEIGNWITQNQGENLQRVLPSDVSPDLENVALAGHSKGGKAAFALALGYTNTSLKFKALIGLDPVAGPSTSELLKPKILNYIPQGFNISLPIAVIGTGLSDDAQYFGLEPPPAPWGCNHPFFFNECKPPVCYFVAKDFGHMDMVNDWLVWLSGIFICKTGKGSYEKMRKACGGLFVAFLKAYMFDDAKDLTAIVDSNGSLAPIKLDPVRWLQS